MLAGDNRNTLNDELFVKVYQNRSSRQLFGGKSMKNGRLIRFIDPKRFYFADK